MSQNSRNQGFSSVFYLFDGRIRIRIRIRTNNLRIQILIKKDQKHTDPTDLDSDRRNTGYAYFSEIGVKCYQVPRVYGTVAWGNGPDSGLIFGPL